MPLNKDDDENQTAFSLKFIGEKDLKKFAKNTERSIKEIFVNLN